MKNDKVEFFLCLFGGYLGLHKFYKGDFIKGILYLFTVGLLLVGWVIDTVNLYKVAFAMSDEEVERRKTIHAEKRKEKEALKNERRVQAREQAALRSEQVKQEYLDEKERIRTMKKQGTAFCPKCHGTSLTYVDKKLSIGRAITGGIIAGGAGAVLGGLSSKKGKVKCLNCGHTWKL